MNRLAACVLLSLLAACQDLPAGPGTPLPLVSLVDTPRVSASFGRPPDFSPWDIGPPSRPSVSLQSGMLIVSGVFYVPSVDSDFYERMSANVVRVRHYQGTDPIDSTGAIQVSVHGGYGGGFTSVGGAQYDANLYDMLPGRYRLTIELQGVVYEPGVLLDSVIDVP